jgi:hypothetical protein
MSGRVTTGHVASCIEFLEQQHRRSPTRAGVLPASAASDLGDRDR